MSKSFSRGCHCGSVRYAGNGDPELRSYCHCTDSQHETGGPFSVELDLPRSTVTIEGELSRYHAVADTGNTVTRKFCTRCGSPIVLISDGYPEYICLKAGSLDDESWLSPEMHIFTATKQTWAHISDDLPRYERDAPG